MTQRRKEIAAGLLVALAIFSVWYVEFMPSTQSSTAELRTEVKFTPISVDNPSLRLDKLKRIHSVAYAGRHRNIFSETLPPPPGPSPEEIAKQHRRMGPEEPPPPPPVSVDLKFYGYASDKSSGAKRAFFTNGEDVYIASEGDTLENKFRLLHIGNDSVEVEEISSGRRAVVMIEAEPQAGAGQPSQ
jgi:hypothetical protein